MRRILAVIAAKIVIFVVKLLGHRGSNIGGELALRLCPDILAWFGSKVKDKIIFVTGTNGKTSTNNMIYSIIREQGHACICNELGANLDSGLISAFINRSNLFGHFDADYACLEVDEASLTKVMKHLKPDILVFTNIFRDQLDRFSEIDALLNKIKMSLKQSDETTLIINADDPSLVSLGQSLPHEKYYYGVETTLDMGSNVLAIDSIFCKKCNHRLYYKHYYYGQLGHYTCENCEFQRPFPDYQALIIDDEKIRTLSVLTNDDTFKTEIEIDKNDSYSIYNMLAAISCGAFIGINSDAILRGLESYQPQVGRMERFYIKKPITLNLAKNPVGFNESMKLVNQDTNTKTIAIGVNDLPQDGRDVSWLWDTNFEMLLEEDEKIESYILFGQRRYDMALRLKYAGANHKKLIILDTAEDVINEIVKDKSEVGYILLNYSLLFETQKILKRRNEDAGVNSVPSIS
jgi:UDP-N-acetylmuramyl tripeptide synthase